MNPRRRARYAVAAKGTNLYRDVRTGNYIWRRKDDDTGVRIKRSTKTTNLTYALQLAAKFEDEYQADRAGVEKNYVGWKEPLLPLVPDWVRSLRCKREKTRTMLEGQIKRALTLLKIATAADLTKPATLERRLVALERGDENPEGFTRLSLVRCFQVPLRQFARWLSRRGTIDRNPLADWQSLDTEDVTPRARRAASPEEIARALFAAAWHDRVKRRAHPTRLVYLALLITAARPTALAELDVPDLDRKGRRLDLGPGVGNKHRGEAALDDATFAEIEASVGDRKAGPLFLSPRGERLEKKNLLDDWRESFSLGVVDEIWPEDEERTLELENLVSSFLLRGTAPVSKGGNPKRVLEATRRARAELEANVRRIADVLREAWREKMVGIDVYSLKTTHRTWAEVKGVHPILMDKQLGHSTPSGSAAILAARSLLTSPTGRKHYVDLSLELLDARRSAIAVRELLDVGVAQLRNLGGLLAPEEPPAVDRPEADVCEPASLSPAP